ncbi:NF038130 family PEP-CTERM protein [Roseofilum sp. BLCC_M154]|uniref:NF038130 family PEP-CTERM protein n=1 Tax=Roseofilum acuticapitatum BLCC-M154 TaxID=3022444 RepID=A0ABT7AYH1_9CYAN|nr:NF038130 family PEP-CTERM protein [Roseofilum acuticapitatum]MDJ1171499.1 NF038130 family PEP-CTERM protein [Roseofilum acuticapitatum BLCC-M154]
MFNTMKKIAMGASVVAGVSVLGAPAFAGTLTGVSTTGDVRVFEQINAGEVELSGSNGSAAIIDALGSAGSVELDDNIDYGWGNETASTLTANFTDGSIMFGSVGQADWLGSLGTDWTNGIYNTYDAQFGQLGISSGSDLLMAIKYDPQLSGKNVFQRLSDPNIQSVTSNNGEFSFELAGHDTFASGLQIKEPKLAEYMAAGKMEDFEKDMGQYLLFNSMKASEVVKYSLDGGTNWEYAYSFGENSYASGVVDAGDNFSFTRNFQFTVGTPNPDPVDVPEPSALLGLAAIGGLVAAAKRRKNA